MDVDISYLSSNNWVEADMRERMRWLRENDPVRWSETDNLWLISRYEDVVYCSKHQEIFTSGQGVRPGLAAKIRGPSGHRTCVRSGSRAARPGFAVPDRSPVAPSRQRTIRRPPARFGSS